LIFNALHFDDVYGSREGQVLHEGGGILQWHLAKINCHQKRQNISWTSWVLFCQQFCCNALVSNVIAIRSCHTCCDLQRAICHLPFATFYLEQSNRNPTKSAIGQTNLLLTVFRVQKWNCKSGFGYVSGI